jgi:hypothetical protein
MEAPVPANPPCLEGKNNPQLPLLSRMLGEPPCCSRGPGWESHCVAPEVRQAFTSKGKGVSALKARFLGGLGKIRRVQGQFWCPKNMKKTQLFGLLSRTRVCCTRMCVEAPVLTPGYILSSFALSVSLSFLSSILKIYLFLRI